MTISVRPPDLVMRLARLGSFHQTRLSFMRILTRRMAREAWRFERTLFDINKRGEGHAVYIAHTGKRAYSLIAFAHDLPPEKRSDRVIADAWDATFTLFDGIPTEADINRLARNVPLQEAGRISERELSLSRANRSARLWDHVVTELAQGRQPDREQIDAVGYLMRTTAVYGSGKFGAADRDTIAERPEFQAPFQVEMLSVYLIRWFVIDLVQHLAECRAESQNSTAAALQPDLAHRIGIGNSTGLGMAPFLLNHPDLFNNWISARERAISIVRNLTQISEDAHTIFLDLMERSRSLIATWQSSHPIQQEKLAGLKADLDKADAYLKEMDISDDRPWNKLYLWAEDTLSLEGQEWLASLMLEPYGALVDPLAETMATDAVMMEPLDGAMTIGTLRDRLQQIYAWALETDWTDPDTQARAWYVSAEKLEPRLGQRFEEPIEPYEQPLAPGRDAALLYGVLMHWPDDAQVADFCLKHPEHRHSLRRLQTVARAPYAEIRDNTISGTLLPIDMLRCKLAFFGATQFDPRSDRWVRICMYGNAPLPRELSSNNADFWVYPDADEITG